MQMTTNVTGARGIIEDGIFSDLDDLDVIDSTVCGESAAIVLCCCGCW